MGITAAYEDSATIGGTEYSLPNDGTTLTPITVDGCYQWWIDFNGLTAVADEYEVRVYEKVTSGGTQRVIYGPISINKPEVLVIPSLLLLHGWDVTVKKIAGTDRTIGWSGRQVT
jgi:hypothetical protein